MPYDRVIVLFTDTWRRDHLGFYGNEWIRTSAVDRLARESVVFEDVYPGALPTVQVRRAYFTGRRVYPWRDFERWMASKDFRSWCYGWQPLAPDDVSLTELLKKGGFVTGLIGDIPFYTWPGANFNRAFDSYEYIRGKEYDRFRLPHEAPIPRMHLANYGGLAFDEDYFAPQVFRSAMRWLEENHWREKFYLHLELWDPHEFWHPPQCYVDMYDPGFEYRDREEMLRLINPPGRLTDYSSEVPLGYPEAAGYTERQLRHIRALYAGMVTQTDFWTGVFLDHARQLGVLDEALVIFFSDHGTLLGEHGAIRKPQYALYDEIIRLPLAIRFPDGQHAGHRVRGFVYDHDLTATLLSLLGLERPGFVEGVDAMPLVTGEAERLHDYVICGYHDFVCVRDRRWHYIAADRRRVKYPPAMDRLYDVGKDPQMARNVIDDHPEAVGEMRRRIEGLWRQYGLEYRQP